MSVKGQGTTANGHCEWCSSIYNEKLSNKSTQTTCNFPFIEKKLK